jgi:hypothetical protein
LRVNGPAFRRFLDRSLVLHIATLSPAGNPDVIPLWFVRFRGRICMSTRSENPIVRDLLRNPEVVLLFRGEGGRRHRVLRVRGRATFRTDRSITLPVYTLSAVRYYLSPGGISNTFRNRRLFGVRTSYYRERAGEGGVIEVVPESAEFLPDPHYRTASTRPSNSSTL